MSGNDFHLRSADWSSFKYTAPTGGVEAGDMVKVNDRIGVVSKDADAGDEAVAIYRSEAIVVPKEAATGITFSLGSKVYYDETNARVTSTSAANTYVGTANEAASASATTVEIDLKGDNSEV